MQKEILPFIKWYPVFGGDAEACQVGPFLFQFSECGDVFTIECSRLPGMEKAEKSSIDEQECIQWAREQLRDELLKVAPLQYTWRKEPLNMSVYETRVTRPVVNPDVVEGLFCGDSAVRLP